MLFLCCFFVFGNYFCCDYPGTLEKQIEIFYKVDKQTYGILYTSYAVPNLFIPIFAGSLFDKIGSRNGILIFTVILCLGQGIFTLGGYHLSFELMVLGRIIFGIGCESMYVGQSAIVSEWFINYELPFAMSMVSCLPLIGSFVGGAVIPSVYHHALMVGGHHNYK